MSSSQKSGRLVLNHSTHIPGLLPVLTRLAEQPGIQTVTPGRLARVKGRPVPLKIKVTVPITGGHKMQARSKGNVQEVFVVTSLNAQDLQKLVDRLQKKS
ncbi:MAG TPA: DUF2103 domain-containing protein [Anaerolineae bacterium]|nr:hypothetical protein [Anaerolineae bacterium]MCB0179703.1 hypothetical protein [Anaerolineae bacterium]MCB0223041.1 hypothetical protein [Anaerolineae bacterium]MCB9104524.1 hypothetical protein [Anaerolineales bacterium]HRV91257.1 DUF2103 domain-containing protein [Anaerolineae bacterium]